MTDEADALGSIALSAGKIVRKGFHSKKSIRHKGAVDLVTGSDLETELFLKEELEKIFPECALVGEESHRGELNFKKAIYIDPIDGTSNFVHGIPHLAISLGLWDGGEAVAAAVYNPILDNLFLAAKGKGAWLNRERLHVSREESLLNSLVATGFPYAKVKRGEEYRWVLDAMGRVLPNIRDIRRLGAAALDLAYLAQGIFGAFYEIDLKPWDVAAGILLVEEAGGVVSNLEGSAYRFSDKGIVAGTPEIHRQLLELLPEYRDSE